MHTFIVRGSQVIGARKTQEDAVSAARLDETATDPAEELVVVADGAGAHTGGRMASVHAVDAFRAAYVGFSRERATRSRLVDALHRANDSIAAQVRIAPQLRGMGSTIVGVAFREDSVHWVSVGDSHLYRIRDGAIAKLNADHSFGGYIDQMRATGTYIDPTETLPRNTLLSALTGDRVPVIDCPAEGLDIVAGDRYVVCTDGVNSVPLELLTRLSGRADSPERLVELVLSAVAAKRLPRQDNTTLVVVDALTEAGADASASDPLEMIGRVSSSSG